jgi:hypothetical protein
MMSFSKLTRNYNKKTIHPLDKFIYQNSYLRVNP